jgi:hypothetical protein
MATGEVVAGAAAVESPPVRVTVACGSPGDETVLSPGWSARSGLWGDDPFTVGLIFRLRSDAERNAVHWLRPRRRPFD